MCVNMWLVVLIKVKVVPYSICERRVRSWSQSLGNRKPRSRLPLLSARPAVTFPASEHHWVFWVITVLTFCPVPNYTAWWQRYVCDHYSDALTLHCRTTQLYWYWMLIFYRLRWLYRVEKWTMIQCNISRNKWYNQSSTCSSLWPAVNSYVFCIWSVDTDVVFINESKVKQVKSFLCDMAHQAVLISVSMALSQIPAYATRPQIVWYGTNA